MADLVVYRSELFKVPWASVQETWVIQLAHLAAPHL